MKTITATALTTRNVANLKPYDKNSRKHGEAQVAQIADSIKEFGFTNPVLIDEHDTIIAGEGRFLAANKLKLLTVPCIVLPGLTEAQRSAYVIADNKLALNASWNDQMLQAELDRIAKLDYDLNLTGFSDVEIAKLLTDLDANVEELASEVDVPQPETDKPEPGQPQTDKPESDPPQAQDTWQGMPDYDQPAAEPFQTIRVHFKEQAAVDAFATLIAQKLTDKTKSVWYPQVAKRKAEAVYA